MKNLKKISGILLAVVMILACSLTAFAANITISDDDSTTSTYVAYKLLNATNAVNADGSATDKFAYTLNEKYTTALQTATGKTTEADIIAYISALSGDDVQTFADSVYAQVKDLSADATASNKTFSDVAQGYYLIAETVSGAHPDTASLIILDTAGQSDVTVTTKEDFPTVVKKVQDTDDSTGDTTGWQDSADYDIGDEIPYQITGTVSGKYANYKEYYYSFTDTMTHLTYKDDSVKVMVGNTDVTGSFTTNWNASAKTLTVTCSNLKNISEVTAESKIIVTYTATLDADANIGSTGNPNTVYLTYSNNPYHEGDGTPTNDTPTDKNIVFTFKTVVNKVDKDGNALKGAGFTLYKYDAASSAYKSVGSEIKGDDLTTFEYKGLDAGQYKIVETTVPDGYNKASDIEFTIAATHDEEADNPALKTLTVTDVTGAEVNDFTVTMASGTISTDVVNNSGTELPSTGGIGTTIFYVIGGILVIGAGVLLVTKRRMKED